MKKKNFVIASLVAATATGVLLFVLLFVNFDGTDQKVKDITAEQIPPRHTLEMTPEEMEEKKRQSEEKRRQRSLLLMVCMGNAEELYRLLKTSVDPNIKIKDEESGKETSLLMVATLFDEMRTHRDALYVFECFPNDAILRLLVNSNEKKTKNVIRAIRSAGGRLSAKEEKELYLWDLYGMLKSRAWEKLSRVGDYYLSTNSGGVNGFHLLAYATTDATTNARFAKDADMLLELIGGRAERVSIDPRFVKALLNAGADINGKTEKGRLSPLAIAVMYKNARAVELFLENGANPNDSIPLGANQTKSLMDLAIDIYKQSVRNQEHSEAIHANANLLTKLTDPQIRLTDETVQITKKIMLLMARATRTELTEPPYLLFLDRE